MNTASDAMKEPWREYLRRKRLKTTQQREAIVDAFLRSKGHVALEDLLTSARKRNPSVGLATVYRTVKLLEEAGLAHARQFGSGHTLYEVAGERHHHDHLICQQCNHIIEFENDEIEALQEQVARRVRLQHHPPPARDLRAVREGPGHPRRLLPLGAPEETMTCTGRERPAGPARRQLPPAAGAAGADPGGPGRGDRVRDAVDRLPGAVGGRAERDQPAGGHRPRGGRRAGGGGGGGGRSGAAPGQPRQPGPPGQHPAGHREPQRSRRLRGHRPRPQGGAGPPPARRRRRGSPHRGGGAGRGRAGAAVPHPGGRVDRAVGLRAHPRRQPGAGGGAGGAGGARAAGDGDRAVELAAAAAGGHRRCAGGGPGLLRADPPGGAAAAGDAGRHQPGGGGRLGAEDQAVWPQRGGGAGGGAEPDDRIAGAPARAADPDREAGLGGPAGRGRRPRDRQPAGRHPGLRRHPARRRRGRRPPADDRRRTPRRPGTGQGRDPADQQDHPGPAGLQPPDQGGGARSQTRARCCRARRPC